MREKDLSQGDLARLACVSTATVWGWIHESLPQRRTAEILCQKLDVSRRWLITGIGKRQAYRGNPNSTDFYLSLLEKFEEIDSITIRNETESRTYKSAAKDLRKLADLLKKKPRTSAVQALYKLALRYERMTSRSSDKDEIRAHAKDLERRQRGAGILFPNVK